MNLPWRGSFCFLIALSFSLQFQCILMKVTLFLHFPVPHFFFAGGHEIDEQNHSKNHEWFSFVFHPSIQTGEKTSTEAPKSTPFEAEVVLASDSEDGRWGVSVRYDCLENSWVFGCSFLKGFNPLLGP